MKKGFTLIEIMVVIGMIAIMSGIILVVLNDSRKRADDANIKSTLANVRNQGALFAASTNTFAGVCDSDPFLLVKAGIEKYNGGESVTCKSDANNWIMYSPLKLDSTTFWCVDNEGASKKLIEAPEDGVLVCP